MAVTKAELYKICKIKPSRLVEIDKTLLKILDHIGDYKKVEEYTKVPWFVVAALHMRESGCDFKCNLANGEPISQKTKLVPKGYGPWNNWYDSAIFALKYDGLDKKKDWSLNSCLETIMAYNGRGYEPGGKGYNTIPKGRTPYLWSFTDQYDCGKFTEKWVPFFGYRPFFSRDLVDQQIGVCALFKRMEEKGYVLFPELVPVPESLPVKEEPLPNPAPMIQFETVVAPKSQLDAPEVISTKDRVKNFFRRIFG